MKGLKKYCITTDERTERNNDKYSLDCEGQLTEYIVNMLPM